MMELVDMRDLGSRAAMRWGSSPHARTNFNYVYVCKGLAIKAEQQFDYVSG